MISGGKTAQVKTTDVGIGRQILCKEKPNTPATSPCAKKLAQTVKAAKQGLTPAQQKLWRQMVFTPAVLNAERFSKKQPTGVRCKPWDGACLQRKGGMTKAKLFKLNVKDILAGKLKFKDIFGKQYKWADYLKKGAAIIKKVPVSVYYEFGSGTPK